MHVRNQADAGTFRPLLLSAYAWSDSACPPLPLFYDVIA
jgi:hypothetical protein